MIEIECDYTDDVVCPYCGHEHSDSWEIDFGPGMEGETLVTCGECEKDFIAARNVSVSYSTRKEEK